MTNALARVLCTFPDCCRVVAMQQFKNHFVANHLREGEVFSNGALVKYSHDANDWRISDVMLAPKKTKKPKKSRGRRSRASVEEMQQLKKSVDKIEKTLAALSKEMLTNKSTSPAAAIIPQQPSCDLGHTREFFVSRLTAVPSDKCLPTGSNDAARPIGKVAPSSRPQKAKRRLENDLDEDSVVFSIPNRDVKSVDGRDPSHATVKPSCVSPGDGVRPPKLRRAEMEEEGTTAKAEVIVAMMSSDGVPDVTRTLRGSRMKANSAVRRTWMDANRAGVLCELESDKNGYCRLVIQNPDGTADSIEARKVCKAPKFRKLFASSGED